MQYGLSKSRLAAWRQCPKRLWLQVHRPELLDVSAQQEQRFQVGFEVGEIARKLFPGGILIHQENLQEALQATGTALSTHPTRAIFEATFEREGVLIRADILIPDEQGWRMVEVKSSTGLKDYHIEDCTIQSWVVGTNLHGTKVELAHINNKFTYPGNGQYQGLFKIVPVTQDIAPLLGQVPSWVAGARATLAGPEPVVATGKQCDDPWPCPFQTYCGANAPTTAYPIAILPRLSAGRREQLEAMAVSDIREIPEDFPLTDNQARVRAITMTGQSELSLDAANALAALPYPRYYMDFETVSLAVPIWAGTHPYQKIPVQWSCHIETAPGVVEHRSYVAEGNADPRRAFAQTLLAALGSEGTVFVYKQEFELGRLRELARDLPDLFSDIDTVIARVVDLLPITREHYYHPDMMGSWSIKVVLPTIAPDLSYEEMEIGDGGAAVAAWREILHPNTNKARRREARDALARYCALDTWAMVRLAWFLAGQRHQSMED